MKLPGYIALTTTIIITFVMTLIAIPLAFSSLSSRLTTVSHTAKRASVFAADACIEQALLNYSLNSAYSGNETMSIDNGATTPQCTILPFETQGSNKIIKVTATVRSATTNYILTIDDTTLSRISFSEVGAL